MNTATVKLTEVKNTESQAYDNNTQIIDHGYVAKGNGIVLAEFNVAESDIYRAPLFVPAITTTHEALISNKNMMHPNLVRKQFASEEENAFTRFLLTNVHWTFTKGGNLAIEEADEAKIIETDAAGFYRQHLWTGSTTAENASMNTIVSNTAYLLVPTELLPIAVWNSGGKSGVRRQNTIGIRFDDYTSIRDIQINGEDLQAKDGTVAFGWYTLDGRKLSGKPTHAGVYIHNQKKVVVRREP